MKPDYYDSLSTVDRMTHGALLERHDAIEKQVAELANLHREHAEQIAEMTDYLASTNLARVLRWLRLL